MAWIGCCPTPWAWVLYTPGYFWLTRPRQVTLFSPPALVKFAIPCRSNSRSKIRSWIFAFDIGLPSLVDTPVAVLKARFASLAHMGQISAYPSNSCPHSGLMHLNSRITAINFDLHNKAQI